ncbi:MAG: hypothetical protein Q8T13_15115 [Acidobacteriota bacterium]|nr:hypothetical protein [Acidobacteriota bacterium]
MFTRLLLVVAYPFFLLAWGLNWLRGRDPLRLHEPDADTLWIQRGAQPGASDYFSEASVAEGLGHGGSGSGGGVLVRTLSKLTEPRRAQPGGKFSPAADRERGIPDEVYTLW